MNIKLIKIVKKQGSIAVLNRWNLVTSDKPIEIRR